ncbi:MAG: glycosyltransferase family 87 protein [Candidatus Lokiarchaeia archaeon]|nr:glycosyltransferase family 87 protein [Candidatus Lokiarchaeia archaeon]
MSIEDLSNQEEKSSFQVYIIFIFVTITIILIELRIFLYFFEISEWIQDTKDIDFYILTQGMNNGLINFYNDILISNWPPYYLYFWYFLFYPIYLIPPVIGVYVWDILRLVLIIFIIRKAPKVFKNRKDLLIFYILSMVGYSIDAYYNNVNFLISFFLFYSFVFLEKNKKWISGILFTLSTFKITALLFLPVLLIVKKIKWKELIYYLTPLIILCIPYIIFPDYFWQMVGNWFHKDEAVQGLVGSIDSIMWKALQPSHLMFISLLLIIFLENIKREDRRNLYRIILVSIITVYYIYLTTIVFIIPVVLG